MLNFRYLALLATFAATCGYAADVEPIPAPLPPAGPVVILTTHALDGHGGTLEDARNCASSPTRSGGIGSS